MEKIAVFVDDVDHAQQLIGPMLANGASPVHWVMVACAPRMTHRIGKWVSNSNRESWRANWARALREKLQPMFGHRTPAEHEWIVAREPLPKLSAKLRARLGSDLRIMDARRPKMGVSLQPLTEGQPAHQGSRWAAPVAISGSLSVLLALTD